MKIEHTAYQVEDPVAVARWYVEHLGLTVKRAQNERPFGQFLADDGDTVMLEFYNNPKVRGPRLSGHRPVDPAHRLLDRRCRGDAGAAADRRRLGRRARRCVTPAGDHVAMLRDPWGLAIQFVHRAQPMI